MPNQHKAPTPKQTHQAPARQTTQTAAQQEAEKKHVTRMDPAAVQHQEAVDRSKEDPNAPKPQVGLSSSQLNTATPAMKNAATKEARDLPTNTSPDTAPTEKQADSAQKKFEKNHAA